MELPPQDPSPQPQGPPGDRRRLTLPDFCLVLLVGPSGAGKSTFALRHFRSTEVLSPDTFRAMVSDWEGNQACSPEAFEILQLVTSKRLARKRLTVIDATNLQAEARRPLIRLARTYHAPVVALVFDLPWEVCRKQNLARQNRYVPQEVITRQVGLVPRAIQDLAHEGIRCLIHLTSRSEVDAVEIDRENFVGDQRQDHGPFDIIGDVHGCWDELSQLMDRLGYRVRGSLEGEGSGWEVDGPPGRKLVFLGDLVDRGPKIVPVLRLVMGLVGQGKAHCVAGNHDEKLRRYLEGRAQQLQHGLASTVEQIEREPPAFRHQVKEFLESLPHHYVLDRGRLVVAHGGLTQEMHGRDSEAVRSFALFGDTTGEKDEYGLPVRRDWAIHYKARAMVVYGHTPQAEARWVNRTINIDTGCVYGGSLTALRYPEEELVSVPAARVYYPSKKPFLPPLASPPAS